MQTAPEGPTLRRIFVPLLDPCLLLFSHMLSVFAAF